MFERIVGEIIEEIREEMCDVIFGKIIDDIFTGI